MDSYHGTLLTVSRDGRRHHVLPSYSLLDHRAIRATQWVQTLWDNDPILDRNLHTGLLYLQFDDYRHNTLPSVAFGRAIGSDPIVELVPDTYFFESEGYAVTRQAAIEGALPRWSERRSAVFWRGTATHDGQSPAGFPVSEPAHVPRLALCLALKNSAHADVGIKPWHAGDLDASQVEQLIDAQQLRKPLVPMLQHARYKLQIDIDGVANAWGFFEKLLLGSCILKVASPYEQWFYGDLREWVHYVPVRADLTDLHVRLDWCLSHDLEAEQIGREAQRYALTHTFEHALAVGRQAIRRSFIDFTGASHEVRATTLALRQESEDLLFPSGSDLLVLDFVDKRSAIFMGDGWGGYEAPGMWATGEVSDIRLGRLKFEYDGVLFLEIEPAFDAASRPSQRLQILVNDVLVADLVTEGFSPRTLKCHVPVSVLQSEELVVELRHPDWLRPADVFEGSNDLRQLTFRCRELRLQQITPAFAAITERMRQGMAHPLASSIDAGLAGNDLEPRDLVSRFESLGLNCEFGFVQRHHGLEALSLLRFNGLPYRKLMKGLRENFARIAKDGSLRFEIVEGDRGYIGFERNYDMVYHTERSPEDVQVEVLLSGEAKRLPYLARKLSEDVEAGTKILVIKSDGGLHLEEVASLLSLLARKGDGMLLWVMEADARHAAGQVDLVMNRLMAGYVGRFANLNLGPRAVAFDDWDLMLRNAWSIASGTVQSKLS